MPDPTTVREAIDDVIADSPRWGSDEWALDFLAELGVPEDMTRAQLADAIAAWTAARR